MKKTRQSNKKIHVWSPICWPIWILIGLMWLVVRLPYRTQLWLGKWLGLAIYRWNKKLKHIAHINIDLCFPELTKNERAELIRKNFISIGIAVFETALAWLGSDRKIRKLFHLSGEEHLQKAFDEGKGVILLGLHLTTIELIGRMYAMHHKFAVIYREHKIPIINFMLTHFYQKIYDELIERHNVRATLRRLKKGKMVWYTPDVDAGHFHNVFAPFFGINASSMIASSRLPAITGAKVFPSEFYRRDDGTGYDLKLNPPLENFPTDNLEEDIARINQITENVVRKKPEQYMWQYMRFKTRPTGEERFYNKK